MYIYIYICTYIYISNYNDKNYISSDNFKKYG